MTTSRATRSTSNNPQSRTRSSNRSCPKRIRPMPKRSCAGWSPNGPPVRARGPGRPSWRRPQTGSGLCRAGGGLATRHHRGVRQCRRRYAAAGCGGRACPGCACPGPACRARGICGPPQQPLWFSPRGENGLRAPHGANPTTDSLWATTMTMQGGGGDDGACDYHHDHLLLLLHYHYHHHYHHHHHHHRVVHAWYRAASPHGASRPRR
jgi:hypothetical protein